MAGKAIIQFFVNKNGIAEDLEVPLDITAEELLEALNTAYSLGLDADDFQKGSLKADNPAALIRGSRTLGELGIHNGSTVWFDDRR